MLCASSCRFWLVVCPRTLSQKRIAISPATDISSASRARPRATRTLRSLSYCLFKTSSKLRRDDCSDHRLSQVHSVITGKLMHLDSTGGHPAPPKKGIFLKQVAWRLMFCSEKVDPSRKGHEFVASTRGEADLLNVKDSQIEGAAQRPELHQLVERNHATDETATTS